MGLSEFLSVFPFWMDAALMEGLHQRWDSESNAFLFPWGHMTVTLEDVARITGLRVHGDPVTGTTLSDYRELARDLLGYEDISPGPLQSLKGSALTELLGTKGISKTRDEGMDAYIARMREELRGRWAQEE